MSKQKLSISKSCELAKIEVYSEEREGAVVD
jgi:hypothetical protein